MRIRRDKTALKRAELSRPLRLAIESSLLPPEADVFDYGCGHGSDIRLLRSLGHNAHGWDPAHAPKETLRKAALVNLGFVINVIEDAAERVEVVRRAWSLAERVLVVAARLRADVDQLPGEGYADGCITRHGTFQYFYEQSELRDWLEAVLQERPIAAAPGVFFVFRDPAERERYIASRFRRSSVGPRPLISAALYEQHRELLDPLLSFFTERGRLPATEELANAPQLNEVFGTIPRAFAVVRRATERDHWSRVEVQRREDLLIYLAHAQFNRPSPFSQLAPELRGDIRAFHGNYTKAQVEAVAMMKQIAYQDLLDLACRTSPVGKKTPQALYVHASALDRLPTVLRLYEACARGLVGEVDGANLVKLHRYRPQVSYLVYPRFDEDAHPELAASMIVNLDEAKSSFRDYRKSTNPALLHRKEEFVAEDHPGRAKFARLTKQEERLGLYRETSRIGFRVEWARALDGAGVTIRGHQLRRASSRSKFDARGTEGTT